MVEVEDKKIYQAFYTNSIPIVKRMVSNLKIEKGDHIFEPCGGNGVFIDEILKNKTFSSIEINELNLEAYITLNEKYKEHDFVKVNLADTLLDAKYSLNFSNGFFDKIIANPPYGAWQDYEKRGDLKKLYKDLYVNKTYTLFL